MRIHCQFCGERDLSEFVYLGDADARRPEPFIANEQQHFFEAVYLRDNPAGEFREWWYHAVGCRHWLRVTRDTRTHAMLSTELAHPKAHVLSPASGRDSTT